MAGERVLVVDDDKSILISMKRVFEKEGYETLTAARGLEAIEVVEKRRPMVIFMDVAMPGMNGLEVLERIKEKEFNVPVVIMTGYGSMQTAIKAVQLGAYDYITKPLDLNKVRTIARRALETVRLHEEITSLRTRLDRDFGPEDRFEIVGNDSRMQDVYKAIGTVTTTPNSTTVLITGESGTGKELVARAIHNSGPFGREPFVAVNCSVLPESLLESELFGHEKGAFTGAQDRRLGKFEVAGEGSIFLDEIGDVPLSLQKKLLRVLQEREFERLGGNELTPVRARFIASTNRDLVQGVETGTFREDLFYRLNVITIWLPPLRERRDDIPLLSEYFLKRYSRRFGKKIHGISREVMEILTRYPFPGNVRELENIIERAVAMGSGEMILPHSLSSALMESSAQQEDVNIPIPSLDLTEARKVVNLAFERRYIIELLKAVRGNVSEAADKAGVDRRTIQRLMKRHGVRGKDFAGGAK